MCNRYQQAAIQDAREALNAIIETPFNIGHDIIHPQSPGLVVKRVNGQRVLANMTWGFPLILAEARERAKAKGAAVKPKPVNNARTDKLTSGFWNRWTDPAHRCLIPVHAYAEAVGQKGQMTEAWMTTPDESLFAVAGMWRPSTEWGDCYSMIMTEAVGVAATVHSRMPVILAITDHSSWLEHEMPDALGLCRPWMGQLVINRTDKLWARK